MNNSSNWHLVAVADEIEPDEPLAVSVAEIEIALCKVEDKVYAINNICTHEHACMSDGFVDGDVIECPLHQAQFHIPTGKVMTSPADVDLETYLVRVEDGNVYVQVDSEHNEQENSDVS